MRNTNSILILVVLVVITASIIVFYPGEIPYTLKLAGKILGDFVLSIDPRVSNAAEVSNSRLIIGKEISKKADNFITE